MFIWSGCTSVKFFNSRELAVRFNNWIECPVLQWEGVTAGESNLNLLFGTHDVELGRGELGHVDVEETLAGLLLGVVQEVLIVRRPHVPKTTIVLVVINQV